MKHIPAFVISAAVLYAAPAFAWDLPSQVTASKLHVIGQGDKFGPPAPQAFALPQLVHAAKLSAVGQGAQYGPTPPENFSLPPQVHTKALSVVGHP